VKRNRRIAKCHIKQHLRNLKREKVGGGFVVAAHENRARESHKISQLTRCGFTTKKPGEPRKLVIQCLVQGTQNPLRGRGNCHTTSLAATLHDVKAHIPRDDAITTTESGGKKLAAIRKESASASFTPTVL